MMAEVEIQKASSQENSEGPNTNKLESVITQAAPPSTFVPDLSRSSNENEPSVLQKYVKTKSGFCLSPIERDSLEKSQLKNLVHDMMLKDSLKFYYSKYQNHISRIGFINDKFNEISALANGGTQSVDVETKAKPTSSPLSHTDAVQPDLGHQNKLDNSILLQPASTVEDKQTKPEYSEKSSSQPVAHLLKWFARLFRPSNLRTQAKNSNISELKSIKASALANGDASEKSDENYAVNPLSLSRRSTLPVPRNSTDLKNNSIRNSTGTSFQSNTISTLSSSTTESFDGENPPPGGYLLPPQSEKNAGKPCLVLDLDETLVHSSFKPIDNPDFTLPIQIESQVYTVYVQKRPLVDEFLRRVSRHWEVVVFTASLEKYGGPVLDWLESEAISGIEGITGMATDGSVKAAEFREIPQDRRLISHRLYRNHCILHSPTGAYMKPLHLLGRPLTQTIIIDNSAACFSMQKENGIRCEGWFGWVEGEATISANSAFEEIISKKSSVFSCTSSSQAVGGAWDAELGILCGILGCGFIGTERSWRTRAISWYDDEDFLDENGDGDAKVVINDGLTFESFKVGMVGLGSSVDFRAILDDDWFRRYKAEMLIRKDNIGKEDYENHEDYVVEIQQSKGLDMKDETVPRAVPAASDDADLKLSQQSSKDEAPMNIQQNNYSNVGEESKKTL